MPHQKDGGKTDNWLGESIKAPRERGKTLDKGMESAEPKGPPLVVNDKVRGGARGQSCGKWGN